MKQILFSFLLLFFLAIASSQSTIRIADNNVGVVIPPMGHVYTDLQAAISASFAGDTIFVVGSETSYGNITITDELYIFGTGHNPDPALARRAELGTVTFTQYSGGSVLSGFRTGYITVESGADDIEISNCWITGLSLLGGSGYLIEGNYMNATYLGSGNYYSIYGAFNVSSSIIRNNIFQSSLFQFDESTVLFDQNLFLHNGGVTSAYTSCSFITLENNIFLGVDDSSGCASCVYPVVIVGSDTTNGNLDFYYAGGLPVGQDPLIVGLTLNDANYFTANYNYQSLVLAVGSPAIGAGTGGQDLGVLAGLAPYTDHGHPPLPRITSWTSTGQIIQAGGSINITIQAKSAE